MPEKINGTQGFLSRRGFVQVIAAGAITACLPACQSEEEQALGFRPGVKNRTPFIIPNEDFYLVAVDPGYRPSVTPGSVEQGWSLQLVGPDNKKRHLRYAELEEKANRSITYTFECIGNEVGGTLIGNAKWKVTPLKTLLQQAGLSNEVKSVMFEGLDDFYSSVSIERAMDDYAFIAIRMNGEPLPAGHGFPARVILPDLYGMKQPRWLRRITLLEDAETTSYWERRGWAGEVPVKNFSRLDPVTEINAGEDGHLTGVAFAGVRGIGRVEVSLDNGQSWLPCKLETPARKTTWSLWSYQWRKPGSGIHPIMVRAVDGKGRVQTAKRSRSYPDGASGYHRISLEVAKPSM